MPAEFVEAFGERLARLSQWQRRQLGGEAGSGQEHRRIDPPRQHAAGDGCTEPAEDEAAFLDAYRRFASPSGAAMTLEELRGIEDAFAMLPEDYREVILLSRVVGLKRPEVATQMGRSEASVRNLLHRALLRLSALLDESEE